LCDSGLGQALIQIAQDIGAEIFATVGSAAKRQLLVKQYAIPVDHIFNSRDLTFAKGVMRMTKGSGVDVIVNSLEGESLRRTWECIALFGRFVEIGVRDILANSRLDMAPFSKSATFASVHLDVSNDSYHSLSIKPLY
jgi:NADPH:quinone reductase-like Zn-dependent oxidoreductase